MEPILALVQLEGSGMLALFCFGLFLLCGKEGRRVCIVKKMGKTPCLAISWLAHYMTGPTSHYERKSLSSEFILGCEERIASRA